MEGVRGKYSRNSPRVSRILFGKIANSIHLILRETMFLTPTVSMKRKRRGRTLT